jgi:hypothetical protein
MALTARPGSIASYTRRFVVGIKNSRAASNGRPFFNTRDASFHRKQMTTPMKCFSLFGIFFADARRRHQPAG